MLHPVLDLISPGESNYVEAMAIPFQQVARVVQNDYDIPEKDVALLEEVFDLDLVAEKYNATLVDPIKWECFDQTKYEFFIENIESYASVWFRLGLKYPAVYVKAWIDQTKGFWNGGYQYWIYEKLGSYEPLGFKRLQFDNLGSAIFNRYIAWIEDFSIYEELACSIGLHVWILIGCMALNILKKRKEYLVGVPALIVLAGLWMCTPVFTQFRYGWPVFLIVPFIFCLTAFQQDAETTEPGLSS